jgi:calcium/calmodulin-dependent protein kinase I
MGETSITHQKSCEYKTGKVLGQGSYATVKEASKVIHVHQLSTNEKFAIKQLSKALMSGKEEQILNEIEILTKISRGHPNIVTLVDYFETPNNRIAIIISVSGNGIVYWRGTI